MTDFHIADPRFPSHRFPVIYAPAKIAAVISLADQLLVLQASNSTMISRARAHACVCGGLEDVILN
jgi:hypothetical protein